MVWKKRKKQYGLYNQYSIINKYLEENKINNKLLNDINSLSLEDLIAIKLELSTRILGGKYYNFPLIKSIRYIATDAVLKTAISIARTKKESARFLGMRYSDFKRLIKKYKTEPFFERDENGDEMASTEEEEN